MYIDTHCHLDFDAFEKSRHDLMASCREVGVEGFLVPATTLESWHRIFALAKIYPNWRTAYGLHPYFLETEDISSVEMLAEQCEIGNAYAVGEIGLDCWPGATDLKIQQSFFQAQLAIAKDIRLPVIIHARKSYDLILQALRKSGFHYGGIIHAFNGSLVQANKFRELGFVLGIGGTITYPRALKARRVLSELDNGAFVLETDSPDMPLCGFQGEVNTPLSIPRIANCIANIRQVETDIVVQQAKDNLLSVFPKWYEGVP